MAAALPRLHAWLDLAEDMQRRLPDTSIPLAARMCVRLSSYLRAHHLADCLRSDDTARQYVGTISRRDREGRGQLPRLLRGPSGV